MLAVGLFVGGCSLGGGTPSTSTSLSTSTSDMLESTTLAVTSTSTTEEASTTTSGSSTTITGSSTTISGSSTTLAATSTTAVAGADKTARYQQSDPHLVYAGRWKISDNAGASGGRYTFANLSGCSVTINFVGTHLSLIAKKSSSYGIAKVTLDGAVVGTIDLYSVNARYQQKVWQTATLAAGTHTVTIAWTGTKRGAATDTNINIDAVEVTGTLQ
jgi:hypothetical protein